MTLHRTALALAAVSLIAAGCGTTDSRRTGAYTGPGPAGSGTATTPQRGGAPIAGADQIGGGTTGATRTPRAGSSTTATPPNIYVPAAGSGEGSSRANSNDPTGQYSGPGPAGSGTALPNQGRSSATIAERAHDQAVDRRQMSELLGADVKTPQGEKIGDVTEVLLDANGRPALAIVSTGGFLGVGDSKHAVPYSALKLANDGSTDRVLAMTKEELRQAPSFSDARRPDMSDPAWMERNSRAYPQN